MEASNHPKRRGPALNTTCTYRIYRISDCWPGRVDFSRQFSPQTRDVNRTKTHPAGRTTGKKPKRHKIYRTPKESQLKHVRECFPFRDTGDERVQGATRPLQINSRRWYHNMCMCATALLQKKKKENRLTPGADSAKEEEEEAAAASSPSPRSRPASRSSKPPSTTSHPSAAAPPACRCEPAPTPAPAPAPAPSSHEDEALGDG